MVSNAGILPNDAVTQKTVRTFIAVSLSDTLKNHCEQIITHFQTLPGSGVVKWVKKNNIHLTLKFIGDTSPEAIKAIERRLKSVAKKQSPFSLSLSDIVYIPSVKKTRVIAVGIAPQPRLIDLALQIESKLTPIGIPKEKRGYKAHITIGRVKKHKSGYKAPETTSNLPVLTKTQTVKQFHLIKSTLTPQGPIYTILTSFELSNDG